MTNDSKDKPERGLEGKGAHTRAPAEKADPGGEPQASSELQLHNAPGPWQRTRRQLRREEVHTRAGARRRVRAHTGTQAHMRATNPAGLATYIHAAEVLHT